MQQRENSGGNGMATISADAIRVVQPTIVGQILGLAVCLSVTASMSRAESLSATPYRPTVSNPAELSALHHLELEFGAQFSQFAEPERRSSLPFLAKYPFAERWGVLIGGDAWLETTDAAGSGNGYGDTALALKYYHPVSETLALGVEAGVLLPTASRSVEEGRTDYLANLIASQDIGSLRVDANFGAILQPYPHGRDEDDHAYSWALAVSQPLTARWGMAVELSGVVYPRQPASSQLMLTADYAWAPWLVLDVGHTVGFTRASDDYGVFAGFTVLVLR